MFIYEKHLQYPVRIQNTNPKLASIIISQYGGPYSNRLLSPNINITNRHAQAPHDPTGNGALFVRRLTANWTR